MSKKGPTVLLAPFSMDIGKILYSLFDIYSSAPKQGNLGFYLHLVNLVRVDVPLKGALLGGPWNSLFSLTRLRTTLTYLRFTSPWPSSLTLNYQIQKGH